MNPIAFVRRRPVTTLFLVVALAAGGLFGLEKLRADVEPSQEPPSKVQAYLDYISTSARQAKDYLASHIESFSRSGKEAGEEDHRHKIVATSPKVEDVAITQRFVCQIHSRQHISVCAIDNGYLDAILIKEGQSVKKGDLLFRILPVLYQAKWNAEVAERDLAKLELENTKALYQKKVVSQREVLLLEAKMAKAQAKADLAKAELNFTNVVAPFDGIVDRLHEQLGSLIKEGDILTTLSDNNVMWVYFNMPEKRYLQYMAEVGSGKESPEIGLELANHTLFPQAGKITAIEAKFNNTTGNIPFRADFPNPDHLLRHGQTGTILIKRNQKDAVVIPQRSAFENLAKKYVYVIDAENVVHQREIKILHELDDIYVIEPGVLTEDDKIVLEGILQVREGSEVEFEYREPSEVLANQKNKAE